MNLENFKSSDLPFKHWEFSDCLNSKTLDEISYSSIPDGNRAYDGTRAADHTGQGGDGKLRLFIDSNNSKSYPNLTKVINELQKKHVYTKIGNLLNKDLSNSLSGIVKIFSIVSTYNSKAKGSSDLTSFMELTSNSPLGKSNISP